MERGSFWKGLRKRGVNNMAEISLLNGGNKSNEMKEAVRKLRDDLPDLIEYLKLGAQLRMEKFKALKKQGFTNRQAIELCKGPMSIDK